MVALRKQASPNLSIRGQSHPAAVSAEGTRYRCNDPDLTYSIVERKTLRGLTRCVRRKFNQRTIRIQPAHDLVHRNHGLNLPTAVFFQRHPLNKPNDHAFTPRELCELLDLPIVEAAQEHAIHLHGAQTNSL